MSLALEVQVALDMPGLPSEKELSRWAEAALAGAVRENPALAERCADAELVIRIVNEGESAALNQTYRRKQGPTNVLSFPFQAPPGIDMNLLGDLVICAPVVTREAIAQEKPLSAHWAHLAVHGVLHLLGYDHQDEGQALEMEALETRILESLGFPDPY